MKSGDFDCCADHAWGVNDVDRHLAVFVFHTLGCLVPPGTLSGKTLAEQLDEAALLSYKQIIGEEGRQNSEYKIQESGTPNSEP
jgi:hypothetical protein